MWYEWESGELLKEIPRIEKLQYAHIMVDVFSTVPVSG